MSMKMNLTGIGDPKELVRRMEARGLVTKPTAQASERLELLGLANRRKDHPSYKSGLKGRKLRRIGNGPNGDRLFGPISNK